MNPQTEVGLKRWMYFVIVFLLSTGCIVLIGEFLAGPALQWLFHDVPYTLPTWHRMGRATLFVLFMGFFAGTVTWLYEKKGSRR